MDKVMVKKIFEVLGTEYEENFQRYKIEGYTLADYAVIPFYERTVRIRKISDWGIDEETDVYLCYFEDGWKLGKMVTQIGAGTQKIIFNDIGTVTLEEIVDWFEKQEIIVQMKIIADIYNILKSADKLNKLINIL